MPFRFLPCAALLAAALVPDSATPARGPALAVPPGAAAAAGPSTAPACDVRTPIDAIPATLAQSGSYYLAASLTGLSGQSGITVLADDVSIDLNGHVLYGVPGSQDGICADQAQGTTVRNGSLVGWGGDGLRVGDDTVVEDLRASGNVGTGVRVGARGVVRRCFASGNGIGFRAEGGSLLEHDVARANPGFGILVGGSNGTLRQCVALANGLTGIDVFGQASRWTYVGNVSSNNGEIGIDVAAESLVLENVATLNGSNSLQAGITGVGITGTRIERNLLVDNMAAISIFSSTDLVVAGNAAVDTGSWFTGTGNDVGALTTTASSSRWANFVH